MSDEERPEGGHAQDTELKDSNPNAGGQERAAGGIGVSSERVGPIEPGQDARGEARCDGGHRDLALRRDDAAGHGQAGNGLVFEGTDGERDTRQAGTSGDPGLSEEDTPAEQSTGNPEPRPEGLEPRAGYPSKDPRSD